MSSSCCWESAKTGHDSGFGNNSIFPESNTTRTSGGYVGIALKWLLIWAYRLLLDSFRLRLITMPRL